MSGIWKRLQIIIGLTFSIFISILILSNQSLAIDQPFMHVFTPQNGEWVSSRPENVNRELLKAGADLEQEITVFKPTEIKSLTTSVVKSDEPAIKFLEYFYPITASIKSIPAHDGFPDGFEVLKDLRVEWRLSFTIKNTTQNLISNLLVTEHLGAELEIDPATVERTQIEGSRFSYLREGNIKIEWEIPQLKPDQEATLSFVIYTRTVNGHQLYSETTTPLLPEYLNSGATLSYYDPNKKTLTIKHVPVWVIEEEYLKVSLSATRFDWLIRKQGIFATEPVVINVCTNQNVKLTFSNFNNLESILPEGGQIATYYYIGDNLPNAGDYGWIRAANLNASNMIIHGAAGETNVVWKLWSKIIINNSTQAGDYTDTGYLTFTILETSNYVDENAELKSGFPEGVILETSDLFQKNTMK